MNKRFSQTVWAIGLTLAYQYLAWSQSTTYFDRGTFIYACQNLPGIQQTISSWDLLWLPPYQIGPVLTLSNVTFTGRELVVSSFSSGELALFNFDSGVPLGIHFANGARAFGADFSSDVSLYFSSFMATVSLDNGEAFSFTAPASPDSRFFGFVSPTPITEITFSDGGIFPITAVNFLHEELIGNIFVVQEIPEPGSVALLALGAAALLCRRR